MGNVYDNNRITLDLSIHRIVNVYCVEGDINSRRIIITLTNDGQPYELSDNIYVSYKVRKPDGNIIYNPITDIIDGEIYIDLTEQCTSYVGIAHTELQLIKNATSVGLNDGQVISSMPFNIVIRPSVINNDALESTDEFGTLTKLITENKAMNDSLKELEDTLNNNEKSRMLSEEQRKQNENNRQLAERNRTTNEDTRQYNESIRQTNEQTRKSNEDNRESNELNRQKEEDTRKTNEENRKYNESVRNSREQERIQTFEGMKQKIDKITNEVFVEEEAEIPSYLKNGDYYLKEY